MYSKRLIKHLQDDFNQLLTQANEDITALSNSSVLNDSSQALDSVNPISINGNTITLLKADGTSEDIIIPNFDLLHSFGTNGYQKLSNGLIIQWGYISTVSSNLDTNYYYPIAFPNACLNVSFTQQSKSYPSYDSRTTAIAYIQNTYFRASIWGGSESGRYIAIGY